MYVCMYSTHVFLLPFLLFLLLYQYSVVPVLILHLSESKTAALCLMIRAKVTYRLTG